MPLELLERPTPTIFGGGMPPNRPYEEPAAPDAPDEEEEEAK
jgi:hypothetical protein